jgi:hypothetical protein
MVWKIVQQVARLDFKADESAGLVAFVICLAAGSELICCVEFCIVCPFWIITFAPVEQ